MLYFRRISFPSALEESTILAFLNLSPRILDKISLSSSPAKHFSHAELSTKEASTNPTTLFEASS